MFDRSMSAALAPLRFLRPVRIRFAIAPYVRPRRSQLLSYDAAGLAARSVQTPPRRDARPRCDRFEDASQAQCDVVAVASYGDQQPNGQAVCSQAGRYRDRWIPANARD